MQRKIKVKTIELDAKYKSNVIGNNFKLRNCLID